MARNKYPEETVEKILKAAQRLFLEKGYEQTTIQDIVDQLGGLTKGAVYHHFKSKEEIMDAITTKMFMDGNPFEKVRGRTDLNGLEKMKEVVRLTQEPDWSSLSRQSMPLLKNPRLLAKAIEDNQTIVTPLWLELIEEGMADGSIRTEYPREVAELLTLLDTLWMAPTIFPATRDILLHKFRCAGEIFANLGVPVIDEEMLALADKYFQLLPPELT
ncbi:MAG: TetR/AcrR family transcriptional regulator [Oscillospiraceae bacterium]|nr:TetR/AcrR family transcriptional regulator [Oscillospiraceae bacterium]